MDELIGLHEAAERLGVHYMTAYRHVRIGRLPAVQIGGRWFVDPVDLVPAPGPTPAWVPPEGLARRLVAGDEAGCWSLVEAALAGGADPGDVHLRLLAPALHHVGDEWAAGRLSVADEHRATAVAQRLIGRLGPRFARRGPSRGTVVVGAAPGDQHAVPSALLADLLRAAGYAVDDLGANPLAESFGEVDRALAVLVGATTPGRDAAVRRAVAAARRTGASVLVGGAAIEGDEHARRLGADGWTGPTAADAVAAVARYRPG